MSGNDTEGDWIRQSRTGDREAFGLIVRKYMKQAYFAALGFLGSHEDALDASQEAFVKAFLAMRRFDPERSFYPWYYQILRNHCLNMLRGRRVRIPPVSEITQIAIDPVSADPLPDEKLHRAELRRKVWAALWLLEVEDRELIVARDLLETPYVVLAQLLGCPVGTVMSRLFHARRRLAAHLENAVKP